MEGDAGIGQAEEDYSWLRGDFVTGIDTYAGGIGAFYPTISLGGVPNIGYFDPEPRLPPEIFPTVDIVPPRVPENPSYFEDTQSTAVVPLPVIDPASYPQRTVFETEPVEAATVFTFPTGGVSPQFPDPRIPNPVRIPADVSVLERVPQVEPAPIEGDAPATDWGKVYDEYVVLNPPVVSEVPAVAIDWGDIFGNVITDIGKGLGVPNPFTGTQVSQPGGAMPAKVTVDTRTGAVTPCRRRRRRRLLTDSDLADLSALKTIVGGGQAMNFAVQKAVRR